MIIKRMKLKFKYDFRSQESDDFELNDVLLDTGKFLLKIN